MGMLTDFPVLICDLASGTDAIIGTDVLGSVLPHTLDIKNGLLFTDGRGCLAAVTSEGCHTFRPCFHSWPLLGSTLFRGCTPLYRRYCWRSSYALLWAVGGLTFFAENTGLVVGRTLVDPSRWRVPVLVSNFSQDTVMVEPFSEVGMVTQVSAIQSVTESTDRPPCGVESLPMHLCDFLDQTSRDLDDMQQRQLAGVLLRYFDLLPIYTRININRSHRRGGTYNQYGRWVTYSLCTPPDVTSEDEERGRVCC